MDNSNPKSFTSPCGIYCVACPRYGDRGSFCGCRLDSRHNSCDLYECCVPLGGMDFCCECEYFPCERIKKFIDFNPGKNFAHYRHIAVDNLKRIKDIGYERWAKEMNKKVLSGEYVIQKKNDDGKFDTSPCPCLKTDQNK